uniref:Ig-like domain-containing protein n=1 Tax=Myripristis murdjan TaxID=586833 RepID=A0A667Z0W8_9TELE
VKRLTVTLICLLISVVRCKGVYQTPEILLLESGQSAHMDCSHDLGGQYFQMYWYQQLPGESMKQIVFTVPYNPFKGIYNVSGNGGSLSSLHIPKLSGAQDSAVYFCAASDARCYTNPLNKITIIHLKHNMILIFFSITFNMILVSGNTVYLDFNISTLVISTLYQFILSNCCLVTNCMLSVVVC